MDKINILEICKDAKAIGVSGHIRPDGDCVGSTLALYQYLKKALPRAEVSVYLEEPLDIFRVIKGFTEIDSAFAPHAPFDVFFALDTNKGRLGGAEKYFDEAENSVNIDHHISNANGGGKWNYVVTSASSTSELVYDLMEEQFMDAEIAKAVYMGIVHDTGVFKYSNTSPKTMRIAADLMEYGFDFPALIEKTFYEKTYVQNQILGRALLESILFMEGRCILSVIDSKTMEFYGVTPKDLDGIVNQLLNIKDVECAVFMYAIGTMEFKVSMRSGDSVDVSKIAQLFGGGGHKKAAGCCMNGTYHDVANNLSKQIAAQLK